MANAGGAISPIEFERWITWLEATGEIEKGKVEAEDLYTNEFNLLETPAPAATPKG